MDNKEEFNIDEQLTKSFRFQNRELLDNYVILAVTDIEGKIKHVSTNLCNLFKYKPSVILGKNYSFLIKKDSIKTFSIQFDDARTTKSIWKGEVKHSSGSDKTIWTDTIITPLFNDDNEHIGFILASNDITQEKKLKKINEENMLKKKYDSNVLDFMPTLSGAVLLRTASGLHKLLWIICFTIIFLITWAYLSEVDDIVRTDGKIITTKNIQTISSLDGGVLDSMLVHEGDFVDMDEPILKISDELFKSEFEKKFLAKLSLIAKLERLQAQAHDREIKALSEVIQYDKKIMDFEIDLYESNKDKLETTINILKERLIQRKNDLKDAKENIKITRKNYKLLAEEIRIKRPLVRDKIISRVDYLQLKRRYNDTSLELEQLKGSIPTIKSSIEEIKNSILESRQNFKTDAESQIAETYTQLQTIKEELAFLKNRIEKSLITSPSKGIINKITIKTKGEAISPGKVLVEIIPDSKYLLAEVKISPAEIGFLYIGQPVKLKLRAYDFSLYGGIKGEISYISADTLYDEKEKEEYYSVHIRSPKKHVGENKNLKIKPGMTVDADIITGKKTILDFILKPIIKSLQI